MTESNCPRYIHKMKLVEHSEFLRWLEAHGVSHAEPPNKVF